MIARQKTYEHSPPDVAKRLRVSPSKVIAWLESGELVGRNVAEKPDGRPRYRIAESDLADFLERRSASIVPAPSRHRRKKAGDTIEFFG